MDEFKREQLDLKWDTIFSFLEFIFIVFFVIPILLPIIYFKEIIKRLLEKRKEKYEKLNKKKK